MASLLIGSSVGAVGVLDAQTAPGLYGTPYVRLGPNGAAVWEVYRKRIDTYFMPPHEGISATQLADANRVNFTGMVRAHSGTNDQSSYIFPGMFYGTSYSRSSYAEGQPALVESLRDGVRQIIDMRIGFLEHLAQGGGNAVSAFVGSHGGDNGGDEDLFSTAWGVDGLYEHFALSNDTGHWVISSIRASFGTATSGLFEGDRHNYASTVVITGATPVSVGSYQLPESGDTPLRFQWQIVQEGSNTFFDLHFGASTTLRWPVDNQATVHGLTDPGNIDGAPYQDGALDLDHLIPVMFLGWGNDDTHTDPQPVASLEMGILSGAPQMTGLPTQTQVGVVSAFQVNAIDSSGQVDALYRGTVHFASSDREALLPADYTFTAADQGTHAFEATLKSAGLQQVRVAPSTLQGLTSEQPIEVAGHRGLSVGFGCSSTSAAAPWLALSLLACALTLRQRNARA